MAQRAYCGTHFLLAHGHLSGGLGRRAEWADAALAAVLPMSTAANCGELGWTLFEGQVGGGWGRSETLPPPRALG
jgi:hypothetical protein